MPHSLFTGSFDREISQVKQHVIANKAQLKLEKNRLWDQTKAAMATPAGLLVCFGLGCGSGILATGRDSGSEQQNHGDQEQKTEKTQRSEKGISSLWWSIPMFLLRFVNIEDFMDLSGKRSAKNAGSNNSGSSIDPDRVRAGERTH